MGLVTKDNIEAVFIYHPPDAEQHKNYIEVRAKAKEFASVLIDNTPDCADRSAALRLLRETVMTANAAIALRGLIVLLLVLAFGSALAAGTPKTFAKATAASGYKETNERERGPRGQWYLFPTLVFEQHDRLNGGDHTALGVAAGPGYLDKRTGFIYMGQLGYVDRDGGRPDSTLKIGCHSANCAGCPEDGGWRVYIGIGIPLGR